MNHEEDTPPDGGELIPAEHEQEGSPAPRPRDDQELSIQQLVELERSRIERDNRRTEIISKALELADDQDKRQFQFASERQRLEDGAERRRFILAWFLAGGALLLLLVVAGVTLWMAFFGDEAQRSMAQDLAKHGLVGLAGFGVVSGLIRLVRSLMRS